MCLKHLPAVSSIVFLISLPHLADENDECNADYCFTTVGSFVSNVLITFLFVFALSTRTYGIWLTQFNGPHKLFTITCVHFWSSLFLHLECLTWLPYSWFSHSIRNNNNQNWIEMLNFKFIILMGDKTRAGGLKWKTGN